MKKNLLLFFSILLLFGSFFTFCSNPREKADGTKDAEVEEVNVPILGMDVNDATFNIFVENSGSMKGFFQGKTTLKQIITEYHDRIVGSLDATATFNYINTKSERIYSDIESYLSITASRCTESYTRIDSILSMAMNSLNPNEVNLVFSDYCFESPNGDFVTARSGITKIFERRLREDPSMTVAIMKYDCSFDGFYFPGRIRNRQNLPVYLWAFGPSLLIKKVVNLPITLEHTTMVLEPYSAYNPHFINTHARVISKDNKINVQDWKADRQDGVYRISFEVDLTKSSIDKHSISDIGSYKVLFYPEAGLNNGSSLQSDYFIGAIDKKEDQDVYVFTLCTEHPSPGSVLINLVNEMPEWVLNSNFEGTGIPDPGKTLGIKYLIEGVSNAYKNINGNAFSVKVSLQKR